MSNPFPASHLEAEVPDLCYVSLEVSHARGVPALLYQALESGALVATGPLDTGSLLAVIRKGIHSARDAESALERYRR